MRDENDEHVRLYWFKELKKYYEALYRYCLRLTNGDESRADDLVQQVAMRLMRYPPAPTSVKNIPFYLFRIAKNCWIDSQPTVMEVGLDQAFEIIAEHSGRELQANLELVQILERVLEKMEIRFPGFTQVYRMWLNGATFGEINEACCRNRGYAEVRWYCFLNEVRKLMNPPKSKSTKQPAA